jgi:ABC-2 type transport system permease protein
MTATTDRTGPGNGPATGHTATLGTASPSQPGTPTRGALTPSPARAHPSRAIASLYARLIRRGTLLLAVAVATYAVLEVAGYRSAYPDGISPVQFAMFEDNPAVRMINGVPYALDTAAGFALWDAGWIWQLILAVWAILTTTRFLRGEEDLDRVDLVLAGPVRATRVTGIVLAVVAAAGLLIGAVVTVTMLIMGQAVTSSVLLGMTLAGVSALFASVAAVTCQLVDVRRRAAGLAAAVLGVAWIVRMIGDSTDPRAWLRWLTPLGWMEVLHLYGDPDPLALIPLLLAPVALAVVAVMLRTRRDTGAALLVSEAGREPRLRHLGSPAAFAWRSNEAVLIAWIVGVGAFAAVMGAIVSTMIDWLAGDEGYQRILASMGMDQAATNQGFLAFIGTILGMAVALQVAWRLGATRAEEEPGRLEAILARPVTRLRWLGGHALLSLLGGILLILVGGAAMWAGAAAAASAEITWWDAMRSTLNLLPIVVLTAGLALAAFGLVPRLTVALPVAVTVVGFVLSMLGPALDWPQWALNLSPFAHLALVPAEPWAATSGMVMTGIGAVLAVAGLMTFHRRDLTSG